MPKPMRKYKAEAALTILVQPVREPFVVPLVMRGDLQDARNRAEQTIAEAAEPTTTEALLACAREAGRELRHLSSNGRNVNAASVADRLMSALAAYEADHSTPHKSEEPQEKKT